MIFAEKGEAAFRDMERRKWRPRSRASPRDRSGCGWAAQRARSTARADALVIYL